MNTSSLPSKGAPARVQPLGSVLVIGGCGFLGSHVVRSFVNEPAFTSVSVYSRNPTQNRISNVAYHAGDITSLEDVCSVFTKVKPRVVVHLAYPGHKASASLLRDIVVRGTQNVLQCAAENSAVEALIYTSTDQVVKSTGTILTEENAQVWNESSKTNPYAKHKAIADTLVLKANSPSLRTTSLRVPGIYGEGHCILIDGMLKRLREGQHKLQVGDNSKLFDFVYAESAASAHVLSAKALLTCKDNLMAPKVDGEAFFITDGIHTPFWDFCRKIWAAAGDETPTEQIKVIPFGLVLSMASILGWLYWILSLGQKEPRELRRQDLDYLNTGCTFSIEKATERLGYRPLVDQDEGIRRAVKWALEHENANRMV